MNDLKFTTAGDYMTEEKKNTVRIYVSGYGGEFVMGSITPEQHDYWMTLGQDALEEYAWDACEYVEENRIPEDMDFLRSEGWYECDDIEHTNGCGLDSAHIEVDLPNGETHRISSVYDMRDKYEEVSCDDIWTDYCHEDEFIRETGEIYTQAGDNYCYEKGHYFTAFRSEKGGFYDAEIELPEGHEFDERRLVFFTTDFDGEDWLDDIGYIFPEDSPDEPTMLDNMGGDTNGKGWDCSMFEITRPEDNE